MTAMNCIVKRQVAFCSDEKPAKFSNPDTAVLNRECVNFFQKVEDSQTEAFSEGHGGDSYETNDRHCQFHCGPGVRYTAQNKPSEPPEPVAAINASQKETEEEVQEVVQI